MTQLGEAVHRYHRHLETSPEQTAAWMGEFRVQQEAAGLVVNSRPVSPVLRPHLLSRRQYSNLLKTAELLTRSIERVRDLALAQPQLMGRMDLLPAEKMLASLDPGYSAPPVAALLDAVVGETGTHLTGSVGDLPTGVVFGEALSDLYWNAPPVKHLKKRFKLTRIGGTKHLIQAMMKAWKEFGGKKQPSICVLKPRLPFDTVESHECWLFAELLRKSGYTVVEAHPEELDYREGKLRAGSAPVELIWRNIRAHEFLMHFDLNHALVRAYRDRAVCVVNSFRAELTRKRALLSLLTDEQIVGRFPAAERHAIEAAVPWTRLVAQTRTTYRGQVVDLVNFVIDNRERLVLKPNDGTLDAEAPAYDGAQTPEAAWTRALSTALAHGYVVQERVEREVQPFPVDNYGELAFKDFAVGLYPHSFMGRVQGCTAQVTAAGGFSTLSGYAPAFVLSSK